MGAPTGEVCTYSFRLSEHKTIKKSKELLSDQLFQAFSNIPPSNLSFPKVFFDQDTEIYQRNIKGYVVVLEEWLLNYYKLNVSPETNTNGHAGTTSAIPCSSEDSHRYALIIQL